MSFKSKQRAKHGHLFGDDPLNASSVSVANDASDDPLFSSSRRKAAASTLSSQSTKTNSPVTSDPLLSGIVSSNDTSNSTPILNHASRANSASRQSGGSQIKSSSSSLFGDIDVSKLSQKRASPNNTSRTPSPSIRSSATLKSTSVDDDEDVLFGGSRSSNRLQKATAAAGMQTQRLPTATTASPSVASPKASPPPPPPRIQSPKPDADTVKRIATVPSSAPSPAITARKTHTDEAEQRLPAAPKNEEQTNNKKDNEKQPAASNSSSFFGFFKSNRHLHSKTSTPTSPSPATTTRTASKESFESANEQTENKLETHAPPPAQAEEGEEDSVQAQRKATLYEKYQKMKEKAKHLHHSKTDPTQAMNAQQESNDNDNDEEEEEYAPENNVQFMEDEATRAFANDLSIKFNPSKATQKPILSTATYFAPELMEGLNISEDAQPTIRSSINNSLLENGMASSSASSLPAMSTSSSTPTSLAAPPVTQVDDPWLDPSLVNKPSFSLQVEPSQSSPLFVREQDFEPEKRTAFADLIQSWNKGTGASSTPYSPSTAKTMTDTTTSLTTRNNNDEDEFLSCVAEERKDIAFAGIEDKTTTTQISSTTNIPVTNTTSRNTYLNWMAGPETENPWELKD